MTQCTQRTHSKPEQCIILPCLRLVQNVNMEFIPPPTIYDFYLEWRGLGIGIQGYFLVALQILWQRMQWTLVKFALQLDLETQHGCLP